MVGQPIPTTPRYGVRITTVDPTQGIIRGVMKGDSQERPILVVDIPTAFRWPQVGESWMIEQKNGTWYLAGYIPTSDQLVTLNGNPTGDLSLIAPTGLVRVQGSTDGAADFVLSKASTSVSDYLAPNDGVTDATQAVQEALNSGYGEVIFPHGQYLISTTLTVPTTVKSLRGLGRVQLMRRYNASNTDWIMLQSTTNDHLRFENLEFTVSSDTVSEQHGFFVALTDCDYFMARSCLFDSGSLAGNTLFSQLSLADCNGFILTANRFLNAHGQMTGSNSNSGLTTDGVENLIIGNQFINYNDTGVGNWTNAGKTIISGNYFRSGPNIAAYTKTGIDVAGGGNTLLISNNVFVGGTIGVRWLNNLGYNNNSTVIQGNCFTGQTPNMPFAYGCAMNISVTNANNTIVVKDNYIEVNDDTNCRGIYMALYGDNGTAQFDGNFVQGVTGANNGTLVHLDVAAPHSINMMPGTNTLYPKGTQTQITQAGGFTANAVAGLSWTYA